MPSGVVKWFSREKGYGFIVQNGQPNSGKDVFVHHTGILMQGYRTLETGQRVSYKLREGPNGPLAYDVVVENGNADRICPTCHRKISPKEDSAR